MKNAYTSMKTTLAITISGALILPAAAPAFEAKLSGQVSRMVVIPDDAAGDEIQHVDNGWSGSRFRFTGSDTAENGLTWGFRFEIQARENSAGAANGGTFGDTGDNQDNRYQDLYLSGGWGQVSLGKGDGASNDATEVDLSGTALAASSNHQDNWGGYEIAPGVGWGTVFQMFDGISRQNRVRYDTPSFSGFSVAGSVGQGNATELGLKYKGGFDGHQFGAAVFSTTGPEPDEDTDGDDITGGSASLLLDNGFNFTIAFSDRDFEAGGSADSTTFKVGYKTGMHAFSIDVGEGENGAGQEGETTGFTYLVTPHNGVEIFATIRTLDSDGVADEESADIAAVGGRIKF